METGKRIPSLSIGGGQLERCGKGGRMKGCAAGDIFSDAILVVDQRDLHSGELAEDRCVCVL